MELFYLAMVAIIVFLFFKAYKEFVKKDNGRATVEEWHHLEPISRRFGSQGINEGYVYFVRESGKRLVKIGKAKDPEERKKNDFGTLMPYDFETIHIISSDNYHKTEKLFHHYFSDKRMKGEWFDLTGKDINWVQRGNFPREIADSIKGY
ncbi:GIY-YIG nuclease family protein [Lentibacillus sediminis]|uniref:GIY-YIG nuclease family protein n=1 Tax=Lentibacillus sediminis TaxID=1940529 RepID=UPI000C1C7FAC|nr:GIY-YIG nuclease family protein [Lentibacillus sediminis]